jgi:hypothetical protein
VHQEFDRLVQQEDAKRWHPSGYKEGSVDYSTLLITLHWVKCNDSNNPIEAHNDAIMTAYREGADYALRISDTASLPTSADWVDESIQWLRSQHPIPNLGVAAPSGIHTKQAVLTRDFTHVTHAAIFGFLYPSSLPDWYVANDSMNSRN